MACAAAAVGGYRPRAEEGESVLHRVVREQLATFLAEADAAERPVPRFVRRELEALLSCGDFRRGFLRLVCPSCRLERLIPFSCRTRNLCPTCGCRRMHDIAERLVTHVFPNAPVRQWVLSPAPAVRYLIAYDAKLCSTVLRLFQRAVFAWQRRTAQREMGDTPLARLHPGAVTSIQRAGGSANAHTHFHTLALDGVFEETGDPDPVRALRFHALPAPSKAEVAAIAWEVCSRVTRLLQTQGRYPAEASDDPVAEEEPLLAACAAGSMQGLQVLGSGAGRPVMRFGVVRGGRDESRAGSSSEGARPAHGWDLHAGVRVSAGDRQGLGRLCRYVLRPPLSNDRLSLLPDGKVKVRLSHPWRDGTESLLFSPLDFVARLVPLLPRPRVHQVVYQGVLAPSARLRPLVVPMADAQQADEHRPAAAQLGLPLAELGAAAASVTRQRPQAQRRPRKPFAELAVQTLGVNPFACPGCGHEMLLVETVTEPLRIREMLTARGLWRDAPPRAPARGPPQLRLPLSTTPARIVISG